MPDDVAAVVIGRNEGARLAACLASLKGAAQIVYVDSGSSDGSVEIARTAGAQVVELSADRPFTAARARNAGIGALVGAPAYIQFVDGDCEVRPGWLESARNFLRDHPKAAVVCGRRRERHPEASVWNRLADREWDTPTGRARACGGDAMMRALALLAVGGYRDDLIAGEEPELCVRLRAEGWEVWRIAAEMTWHDAAMTRANQWARRTTRAGYAFAEGAHLHGAAPERHWVAETRRALLWGAVLPIAILLLALVWPLALLAILIYPLQIVRLSRRMGWEASVFTVLGRFPEAWGVIRFHTGRLLGRRRGLIEYR